MGPAQLCGAEEPEMLLPSTTPEMRLTAALSSRGCSSQPGRWPHLPSCFSLVSNSRGRTSRTCRCLPPSLQSTEQPLGQMEGEASSPGRTLTRTASQHRCAAKNPSHHEQRGLNHRISSVGRDHKDQSPTLGSIRDHPKNRPRQPCKHTCSQSGSSSCCTFTTATHKAGAVSTPIQRPQIANTV